MKLTLDELTVLKSYRISEFSNCSNIEHIDYVLEKLIEYGFLALQITNNGIFAIIDNYDEDLKT